MTTTPDEPLVSPDPEPRAPGKPRPAPFTAETAPVDVHSLAYLNRLPLGTLLSTPQGGDLLRLDAGPALVAQYENTGLGDRAVSFVDGRRYEGAVACASLLPLAVRHVPE